MRVACRLLSALACSFPAEESETARPCDREIRFLAIGSWHLRQAWSEPTFVAELEIQRAVAAIARFLPASAAGHRVACPVWSRRPQRKQTDPRLAWRGISPRTSRT